MEGHSEIEILYLWSIKINLNFKNLATEIMKLLLFFAIHLTNAECEVPLAARWCIDAADLEYRKCLAQFNCHVEDSVSCTDDRQGFPFVDRKDLLLITDPVNPQFQKNLLLVRS